MSLRYFNAAGADDSGDIGELHEPETHLIPNALKAAVGQGELQVFGADYPTPDGTCVRDYIHVTDLGVAHAMALEYLNTGGRSEFLNLGTGKGSTVREVIQTVEQVVGRPLPQRLVGRRAGDPPILLADPSRAEKRLGWKARLSLHDMVASSWKFFQKHAAPRAENA
jgi:UDP-glucose 4-epimerase